MPKRNNNKEEDSGEENDNNKYGGGGNKNREEYQGRNVGVRRGRGQNRGEENDRSFGRGRGRGRSNFDRNQDENPYRGGRDRGGRGRGGRGRGGRGRGGFGNRRFDNNDDYGNRRNDGFREGYNRPQRNDYYGNDYYRNNFNENNNNYSEQFPKDEVEEEKERKEREFKDKYKEFITKISELFYGEITKDYCAKIIKEIINIPYLTIFEAMNLIYRNVQIYKSVNYYIKNIDNSKINNINPDTDIKENKYHHEFPQTKLEEVLKFYKTEDLENKKNDSFEDYYYYLDSEDQRRKLKKNIDSIYNYLPLFIDNDLFNKNETKEIKDKLENFCSKNENEFNYHSLYYKTLLCRNCPNGYTNQNKPEANDESLLCPFSHNILLDFRLIYDYRDDKICKLMYELSTSKLFNFSDYLNYIPLDMEKFDLNSFKCHLCQLDKNCPIDYHLCNYYHKSNKNDQKRRPLNLFRYMNQVGNERCYDSENDEYKGDKCPYGDFCKYLHNKNEYNYHIEHFRKEFPCKRKKINGRCMFIKTCYGKHNEKEYIEPKKVEKKNDSEDSIGEEEIEDDEDVQEKKEKIENIVHICRNVMCKKCVNKIKSGEICYFMECKHFICFNCFDKMNKERKQKSKKEKKQFELKCPFCDKELVKNKIIKIEFSNKEK